jgi:tRNA1(Val) A37 N6-methylase TrmN6
VNAVILTAAIVSIIVAVISSTALILVEVLRRQNSSQHAENSSKLDQLTGTVNVIHEDLSHVRQNLSDHIADHKARIHNGVRTRSDDEQE